MLLLLFSSCVECTKQYHFDLGWVDCIIIIIIICLNLISYLEIFDFTEKWRSKQGEKENKQSTFK